MKESRIGLSEPLLGGNERRYVEACLDSGWVSSGGPWVERFEEAIARATGAAHAVACVSGSSALQVALRLVGVGPGDLVLVPTLTFIAPINAIHSLGAEPVFFDCDEHYNLSVEAVLGYLDLETRTRGGETTDRATGAPVRALLPVHVLGNAVDLEPLLATCGDRGIHVIEDAAEALGTRYTGGYIAGRSAGTLGTLGAFSFNGNKIVTTGGGGMIVTADPDLAERARYLTTQAKDDAFRYIHDEVGYNYRLSSLQAALGLAQLEQLPHFLERRRAIRDAYHRGLEEIPGLELAPSPPWAVNNHWLSAVRVDAETYGLDVATLSADLRAKGIESRPLWYPNHLQKPYRHCRTHGVDRALDLHASTLCLPSSSHLTAKDVERVLAGLRR